DHTLSNLAVRNYERFRLGIVRFPKKLVVSAPKIQVLECTTTGRRLCRDRPSIRKQSVVDENRVCNQNLVSECYFAPIDSLRLACPIEILWPHDPQSSLWRHGWCAGCRSPDSLSFGRPDFRAQFHEEIAGPRCDRGGSDLPRSQISAGNASGRCGCRVGGSEERRRWRNRFASGNVVS